jgi:hypothetical protein
MDVSFTVESTNGKTWTATCADPALECEGTDIIAVSKLMAGKIEKWFIETFNTKKKVVVEVPVIKAKVKANVSVRAETPLDEFPVQETDEEEYDGEEIQTELKPCTGCGVEILVKVGEKECLCQSCAYDKSVNAKSGEIDDELTAPKQRALPMPPKKIDGPCAYISDGKGLLAVGICEAQSNDVSDTPGIRVDPDGACQGEFDKCSYYKSGGRRVTDPVETEESYTDDEIDEYGQPVDTYE